MSVAASATNKGGQTSADRAQAQALDALSSVVDPCMEAAGLGLSIVDLGLVRSIDVRDQVIHIELGLTEPGCGFTHALVVRVEDALTAFVPGEYRSEITFNWRDPWTEDRMSDAGRRVFRSARARGSAMLQQFVSTKTERV